MTRVYKFKMALLNSFDPRKSVYISGEVLSFCAKPCNWFA